MSVLFVVFIPIEENPYEKDNEQNEKKEETDIELDKIGSKEVNFEESNKTALENKDEDSNVKTPLLIDKDIYTINEVDSSENYKKVEDNSPQKTDSVTEKSSCEYNVEIESISGSAILTPLYDKEDSEGVNEGENNDNQKTIETQPSLVEQETEYLSLEQALQNLLGHLLAISTDVWQQSDDSNYFQVTFLVENEDVDFVLTRLTNFGIGSIPNTSVSIFPAIYHNGALPTEAEMSDGVCQLRSMKSEQVDKDEFVKSVKSRLTVAQVVEAVKNNSRLTFDFVVLLILAGIISALGLVENSSVILVASMLVSPLMGPILGGTFGLVIRNGALWRQGIKNEIIGLLLCVLIGLIFGFLVSAVNHNGVNWGGSTSWPTSEMQSRGMLRSLWVGVLIALPSGAGVALSILGGNAGSLVGVAISASLLPPAVNCGMLWACSVVSLIHPPEFKSLPLTLSEELPAVNVLVNASISNDTVTATYNSTLSPPPVTLSPSKCGHLSNNDYIFHYSCNMGYEAFVLGIVSLLLTLLNIVCIFFMGVLVLKIKEVAPHTAVTSNLERFWKSDIKVARETYKTLKTTDPKHSDLALLAKKIAMEEKEKNCPIMDDIMEEIDTDEHFKEVTQNLSISVAAKYQFKDEYKPYSTIGPTSNLRLRSSVRTSGIWPHTPATPSSPDTPHSEKNQFTWMGGLKKRNITGDSKRPKTAGILEGKENPFFAYPLARTSRLINLHHERKPRGIFTKQGSTAECNTSATKMPKSQSGRFEITAVKEERRDSSVSQKSSHVKFYD